MEALSFAREAKIAGTDNVQQVTSVAKLPLPAHVANLVPGMTIEAASIQMRLSSFPSNIDGICVAIEENDNALCIVELLTDKARGEIYGPNKIREPSSLKLLPTQLVALNMPQPQASRLVRAAVHLARRRRQPVQQLVRSEPPSPVASTATSAMPAQLVVIDNASSPSTSSAHNNNAPSPPQSPPSSDNNNNVVTVDSSSSILPQEMAVDGNTSSSNVSNAAHDASHKGQHVNEADAGATRTRTNIGRASDGDAASVGSDSASDNGNESDDSADEDEADNDDDKSLERDTVRARRENDGNSNDDFQVVRRRRSARVVNTNRSQFSTSLDVSTSRGALRGRGRRAPMGDVKG